MVEFGHNLWQCHWIDSDFTVFNSPSCYFADFKFFDSRCKWRKKNMCGQLDLCVTCNWVIIQLNILRLHASSLLFTLSPTIIDITHRKNKSTNSVAFLVNSKSIKIASVHTLHATRAPKKKTFGFFTISKYRSGTVNSKSFIGKVLLRIKWKFELN